MAEDEETVTRSIKLRYGLRGDRTQEVFVKYFYGNPEEKLAEFLAREGAGIRWYVARLVTKTEKVLERSK